jgi:hypothetical protein
MKRFLLLTLCAIVIAGCGGGSGQRTGSLQVVDLPTSDMVYSPSNQMIYASVPNTGGAYSNTVAAIDPVSGMVAGSVFVGSNPTKLALSDDGQVLYAAVDIAVRKIDPIAMTAGPRYTLGDLGPDSPYYAIDLAVCPGQPGTFAVLRESFMSYRSDQVAIYDDGVRRPDVTEAGMMSNASMIVYSSQSTLLYVRNTLTEECDFLKVDTTSNGAEITDHQTNLNSGVIAAFVRDVKYDSGLAYLSTGDVVDPDTRTITGSFPLHELGIVEPDVANGRVYFLTQDVVSEAYTLRAFDSQTYVQVSSLALGKLSGTPRSLIRCGTDGLAIGTSNKVYLVRTAALH